MSFLSQRDASGMELILSYFLFYKHIIPLGLKNEGILKGNELRGNVYLCYIFLNREGV